MDLQVAITLFFYLTYLHQTTDCLGGQEEFLLEILMRHYLVRGKENPVFPQFRDFVKTFNRIGQCTGNRVRIYMYIKCLDALF